MTDADHDVTPVLAQPVRGVRKREGYIDVHGNVFVGEMEAREQPEPSWYAAALARGAT